MDSQRMDFVISDAGGLLYVAARHLGGLTPEEFGNKWVGMQFAGRMELANTTDTEMLGLIKKGVLMPLALYQDDGYIVRLVRDTLTPQEDAEWVAHATWKIHAPDGEFIISGTLGFDFDDDFAGMDLAESGLHYRTGAYIRLTPGWYQVDVYSYPPNDLSSAWNMITESDIFGEHPDLSPETTHQYFERTRPDEPLPDWMAHQGTVAKYVTFVIRFTPLNEAGETQKPLSILDESGIIMWDMRKPALCPRGLRYVVFSDSGGD